MLTESASTRPLCVGCIVPVKHPAEPDSYRRAQILTIAQGLGADGTDETTYYIHVMSWNRRLDTWVQHSSIKAGDNDTEWPTGSQPSGQNVPGAEESKNKGGRAARGQKKTPKGKAETKLKRDKGSEESRVSGKEDVGMYTAESTFSCHTLQIGGNPGKQRRVGNTTRSPDSTLNASQNARPSSLSAGSELSRLRQGGAVSSAVVSYAEGAAARVRNVRRISIGDWVMDAWYFAPYPVDLVSAPTLLLCPFCLNPFASAQALSRHRTKCLLQHPPGNEIYFDGALSLWEVDGGAQRQWCRNLCLLGKCFLDHKACWWDVEVFWFYVLTSQDDRGHHILGYFSCEKVGSDTNLACIMTLPCHQRQGYGQLLIHFSFLLSVRENRVGTPERPLSDLGLLSYLRYWGDRVSLLLTSWRHRTVSVEQISHCTGIAGDDVRLALSAMDAVRCVEDSAGGYKQRASDWVIVITDRKREVATKAVARMEKKQGWARVEEDRLVWVPLSKRTGSTGAGLTAELKSLGLPQGWGINGGHEWGQMPEWVRPVPRKGFFVTMDGTVTEEPHPTSKWRRLDPRSSESDVIDVDDEEMKW
ncbi:hypothetical protein M427DRAFT_101540 [Gonapodya prolifera JEL478]|uniref:histone acetyltransferase n=1 Tax=Gonapodya prolifera (strain JEL478) TaxID=1344416 RepID=A0A139A6V3_GONPJ|nr:hypothetical protein M427DRAFT_101540 [Gonapodya prolifera JEL478]|eukprot:KXS12175.1 hypothetical protein M427DRAFT_101540 [Gonapodya prolifera JEL478]